MNLQTPTKNKCSTPKKPVAFGSPVSLNRAVPHLVFLISSNSEDVKLAVIRILLLFHFHVNPNFTWGFQLVERLPIRKKLLVSKQTFNLTPQHLQEFSQTVDSYEPCDVDVAMLILYIKQIVIQAVWNCSPAAPFQSPLKRHDSAWDGWKGNIKLRNYLFIMGDLPKDLAQLSRFVGIGSENIGHTFEHLNKEFLDKQLWFDLMKERIGTFWVDVSSENESVESGLVQSWISLLLKPFGGSLITNHLLRSVDFVQQFKFLKVPHVDAFAAKKFFDSNNSESNFVDYFDQNYFSVWSPRNQNIQDIVIETEEVNHLDLDEFKIKIIPMYSIIY